MLAIYQIIQNLLKREEGQDLVEYALIIALVSIALVVGLGLLTGGINGVFQAIIAQF